MNNLKRKCLRLIERKITSIERKRTNNKSYFKKIFLGKIASLLNENIVVKTSENLFNLIVKMKKGSSPKHSLQYYVEELSNNIEMSDQMIYADKKYGSSKFYDFKHKVSSNPALVALYYALIREIKPSSILETGTAWGSMTSFILCALHKNKKGKLTSIDLPPLKDKLTMEVDIKKENIGLYIPDKYKYRHKIIFGDAKQILPIFLASENVDFFVHDSLHSHIHMAFEYRTAINLMPKDSIILSDDVLFFNTAFHCFCKEHSLKGFSPLENLNSGVLLNRFSPEEEQYSGPSKVGNYEILNINS